MLSQAVAKRYARALIEAIPPGMRWENVASELEDFAVMFRDNKALREVFLNPAFQDEERLKVLGAVMDKMSMNDIARGFLKVLVRNQRLDHVMLISNTVRRFVDEREGRVRGNLISAIQVAPADLREIEETLAQAVGKKVQLEEKIDPAIIGGFIARIGNVVFDGSVRRHLETVRHRLAPEI
ncbi:MAG: ATP synthase subunit delta [Myxococcota bacterium]|nr:ATP synthase subunit delta [Myxococcota bacterium]